jgi:hypothetical protein
MTLRDVDPEKPANFLSHMTLHDPARCTAHVLKTGGATGPLPPPRLFIRYLRRSAQSQARQSAHLLPTIFDFGFDVVARNEIGEESRRRSDRYYTRRLLSERIGSRVWPPALRYTLGRN